MKVYDTRDIRNVVFLGHGASGKTTMTEAILFTSGATPRMGKIDEGNTKSDYLEDEIARKISISASIVQTEWQGRKLNIIDTPGYADFVGEVICGMRGADCAVITVDALTGLEIGTETVWDLCENRKKPLVILVNRAGKEHSKAIDVLKAIQDRFGNKALPIQIPVNPGPGFNRIVDIVSMKEYIYQVDGNGQGTAGEISANLKSDAEELHEKMIEAAAESDDTLMEKYFEAGLTPEEIGGGIKKAIQDRTLFPVLFADAFTAVGVDLVMKLIADSMPSPAEMPGIKARKTGGEIELKPSNGSPLAIQVFKTVMEPHLGELSLFRIFSGSYKSGDELFNSTHSVSERPTLIYSLIGKERIEIPMVNCGDIGTLVKLKGTRTGDSLCSKQLQLDIDPLVFPVPVMDVAVYPKTKGEEDKVSQGLNRLREEDPSFRVRNDAELRQIILEGMGGVHIDVIIDRFKKKNNIEVELREPKIPYRETITGKSDEKYRYKKQTGGRGQYGEVYFRMEPMPRGEGFLFADEIKGGVIPSRFIPAVEKGLNEALERGPLSHCKVIDIKVALYYGSFHTVDSSELAFKMASVLCFRECFLKARPILLEPIYNIEVKVPDAYTGDVMGDLSSRRGKIMGMEPSGIFQIVKAQVPLIELYQYATHLRSLTQGRGAYSRTFSHYEMVPSELAQKIIEANKEEEVER
ncbi:MAG: elongation factor G [Candidatus Latescibacter sp.]|nr:elongation factor G [Candidatus Latescibacter sp.]